MELLSRLTGNQLSWQDLAIALIVAVSGVILVIAFFLLRGQRARIDPLQKLYAEFQRKLGSAGLKRHQHEGPRDFGQRAARRLPAKEEAIEELPKSSFDFH